MVCVDNSEFTRNGDYAPTRFQAQADAVNLLAGAKTQHHPENTVGVMSMAGKTPQVLVTPTPDLGKVLNAMQQMQIEGEVNLATAVQIAQLALKHRENKHQRQRIVVFVGSPIVEDQVRVCGTAHPMCVVLLHRQLCTLSFLGLQLFWASPLCSTAAPFSPPPPLHTHTHCRPLW